MLNSHNFFIDKCKNKTYNIVVDTYYYGGDFMATKSILKNVTIRDKSLGRNFVNALENAKKSSCHNVKLSKKCVEMTNDDIAKVFKEF